MYKAHLDAQVRELDAQAREQATALETANLERQVADLQEQVAREQATALEKADLERELAELQEQVSTDDDSGVVGVTQGAAEGALTHEALRSTDDGARRFSARLMAVPDPQLTTCVIALVVSTSGLEITY